MGRGAFNPGVLTADGEIVLRHSKGARELFEALVLPEHVGRELTAGEIEFNMSVLGPNRTEKLMEFFAPDRLTSDQWAHLCE